MTTMTVMVTALIITTMMGMIFCLTDFVQTIVLSPLGIFTHSLTSIHKAGFVLSHLKMGKPRPRAMQSLGRSYRTKQLMELGAEPRGNVSSRLTF